jgi:hypothetical protein
MGVIIDPGKIDVREGSAVGAVPPDGGPPQSVAADRLPVVETFAPPGGPDAVAPIVRTDARKTRLSS